MRVHFVDIAHCECLNMILMCGQLFAVGTLFKLKQKQTPKRMKHYNMAKGRESLICTLCMYRIVPIFSAECIY